MTVVSATSSSAAYSGYARTLLERNGQGQSGSTETGTASTTAATIVTLSAAASRATATGATTTDESRAALIARAKADVKAAVTAAGTDGKLDLSTLDRRELWAVAANLDGGFDSAASTAAAAEMKLRLGDALRGPEAAATISGKLGGLYTAADAFLDAAGPEEQASDAWQARKTAVASAEKRLAANSDADTSGIANDPVSEYFAGKVDGSTVRPARDFAAVAKDARALLDSLEASAGSADASSLDLSDVDGRTLAAMALNEGEQFAFDEVRAAKQELRSRSRASLIDSLDNGSDPRALSLGIVSQYASMSEEERSALGWSDTVQATAVASYEQTSQVLNILSGASSDAGGRLMSLAAYLR